MDQWSEMTTTYQVTCISRQYHFVYPETEWWRNIDVDVYMNPNWSWDFGTTSNSNLSYRGVTTHEIGHGVTLRDLGPSYGINCLSGSSVETMCGEISASDTWYQYSLTNDDITSANVTYQCKGRK